MSSWCNKCDFQECGPLAVHLCYCGHYRRDHVPDQPPQGRARTIPPTAAQLEANKSKTPIAQDKLEGFNKDLCPVCGKVFGFEALLLTNGVKTHSACGGGKTCAKCHAPVAGQYVGSGGLYYHRECAGLTGTCRICNQQLSGNMANVKGGKVHSACLNCATCKKNVVLGFMQHGNEFFCGPCYDDKYAVVTVETVTTYEDVDGSPHHSEPKSPSSAFSSGSWGSVAANTLNSLWGGNSNNSGSYSNPHASSFRANVPNKNSTNNSSVSTTNNNKAVPMAKIVPSPSSTTVSTSSSTAAAAASVMMAIPISPPPSTSDSTASASTTTASAASAATTSTAPIIKKIASSPSSTSANTNVPVVTPITNVPMALLVSAPSGSSAPSTSPPTSSSTAAVRSASPSSNMATPVPASNKSSSPSLSAAATTSKRSPSPSPAPSSGPSWGNLVTLEGKLRTAKSKDDQKLSASLQEQLTVATGQFTQCYNDAAARLDLAKVSELTALKTQYDAANPGELLRQSLLSKMTKLIV